MDVEKSQGLTPTTASTESLQPIDPAAERRLRWKCDLHLLPTLMFLYFLSFLDRVNIGNARIEGLEADLGMTGHDFNIALFIFFISYILFEVPSNLILKNVAPSTWLSFLMFMWGIMTICQGVVKNLAGLATCRFLLGVFEAGFVAGGTYLISMYYRRYELQWRISLFFSAGVLGGAFGGLLAYAIAKMRGIGGYNGWRWIFIIEGILTVVTSIFAKWLVVDWPETAKFLTDEDRALLVRRLTEDSGIAKMNRLDKKSAKRIFSDWKIYVGMLMYLCICATGYATAFFIPTIIKELGFTSAAAQIRSIFPNLVAVFCIVITAWVSDHLQQRYIFCLIGPAVGTVGYVLLLAQGGLSPGVKYFATFLITSGAYITQPVTLAWLNNNMGGHYKRSVAAAIQLGFGNIGGIIASNVFYPSQRPRYPIGYGVCFALLLTCAVMSTVLFLGLRAENRKRERGERDDRLREPKEELENMGDDHPAFRFVY
ncbi:MAG: hypothetical protein M1817_006884 [Caeruleum heppii]|nr:MAG: hypothetical protein M1817_006884 [Caeruleum heppii]